MLVWHIVIRHEKMFTVSFVYIVLDPDHGNTEYQLLKNTERISV